MDQAGRGANLRYDFVSDNVAGMAPEAFAALAAANAGFSPAYGADPVTADAADRVRALLDADAVVRFVVSGTAANGVAVSLVAQPFESVLAYEYAHIRTDEVGAPGFFAHGAGVTPLPGVSGRIDPEALLAAVGQAYNGRAQPAGALSLTNATEYGAAYTEDQLKRLIEPAKAAGLGVHMDGARLANAAAAGFDVKAIARLGVDVLVLGGAKAGAPGVEALVIFDPARAHKIDARLKQMGQVVSKGRFVAAPLAGLLETGAWLAHAAHANRLARRLGDAITARGRFALAHPVETNSVFLNMTDADQAAVVDRGFANYRFHDGSVRFVCSWATTEAAVDELIAALASV